MENERTRENLERDPLTGLISRQAFQAGAGGRMRPGDAFVWFDIDSFKVFNQSFGFDSGSAILARLAALLAQAFPGDLVSRFSDDHFAVLTTWEGLEDRIEKVQREAARLHEGLRLRAGIHLPSEGEGAEAACDRAKIACDSIRQNHSVAYCLYQRDLGRDPAHRKYIVDALDDAIHQGNIKVLYQPIVRVLTGRICETEALARWEDPQYGLIPPGDFIPSLEQYRDIHKLDLHAVRQVCADFRARRLQGLPLLPTSINLSRLDFELCDIYGEVERAVEESGMPKDLLKIEITESVHGEDRGVLRLGIEKFRQNGYEVWMDDFGSGYSSLNVLKDYSFDTIKFDMKFLSDFDKKDPGGTDKARVILSSNLSMAKQMGIQSLAEGVETPEQLAYLKGIGFEKAQGYLFGKPMALDGIFALPLPKEDFRDAPYYERLGRIELPGQDVMERRGYAIADVRGMALFELCGGLLTPLARNGAYRDADERSLREAFSLGDAGRLPPGYRMTFIASNPRTGADAFLVTHAKEPALKGDI